MIKISLSDVVVTPSKTVRITKYSVVPPSDTKYIVLITECYRVSVHLVNFR